MTLPKPSVVCCHVVKLPTLLCFRHLLRLIVHLGLFSIEQRNRTSIKADIFKALALWYRANTTEHWLTACVVTKAPLLVVLVTLGYASTAPILSLCHTALSEADKNGEVDKKFCAVLLAWIATIRRYVMEEQCAWHPGWSALPQRNKHVSYIPKLASRLWNTIPRMLLPKTLPVWWIDTERCKPCCYDGGPQIEVRHPLSTLIKASAQGVTTPPKHVNSGDVIATLDYLLAPMYQQTAGTPNVILCPKMCHCGGLHLRVTAVRPIPAHH